MRHPIANPPQTKYGKTYQRVAAWPGAMQHWFAEYSFTPTWLPKRFNHPIFGYLLALVLTTLSLIITRVIIAVWPGFAFPGVLIILSIVFLATHWGVGPGIVATCSSVLFIKLVLVPFYSHGAPLRGAAELLLLVGLVYNIIVSRKERKRREAVQQSQQLKAIFEAIADALFVYDKDGHLLQANSAAWQIAGNTILTTTNVAEMPNYPAFLTEKDGPLQQVLQGDIISGPTTTDVTLYNHAAGGERHLGITGAPVRNNRGSIVGAVLIARDITERIENERRTRRLLDAIFTLADTLIANPTQDPAPHELSPTITHSMVQLIANFTSGIMNCKRVVITALNPTTHEMQLLVRVGLTPDEAEQWLQLSPPSSTMQFLPFMSPYTVGSLLLAPMHIGQQFVGLLALESTELEHTYTQEETILASVIAKVLALLLERSRLLQEHAQTRVRELALQKMQRHMDEFIGIASHELKTPLTSIRGNIELISRQLQQVLQGNPTSIPNAARLLRGLDSVETQLTFLTRLVDDFLDVSRIQSERLEIRPAQADLITIVEQAIENQRQVWPGRTIIFQSLDKVQLLPIIVDADRIGQVISNYLTNALKYAPVEHPVIVGVTYETTTVKVWVRDDGPGIPVEVQDQIWQRFYRVAGIETQSSWRVGLGLGLHISRMIIELHHGTVGVESTPGKGSTFWFTLPYSLETEYDIVK